MVPRYARPDMVAIWEPENRFRIWFEIEAHATEALAGLGVVILIAFLWALTRLGSRRIPSRETHPEGSSGSV